MLERVYGDACIPYDLSFEPLTGLVACTVTETSLAPGVCNCSPELGRGPVTRESEAVIRRELEDAGADCRGLADAVAVSLALMWSSQEAGPSEAGAVAEDAAPPGRAGSGLRSADRSRDLGDRQRARGAGARGCCGGCGDAARVTGHVSRVATLARA